MKSVIGQNQNKSQIIPSENKVNEFQTFNNQFNNNLNDNQSYSNNFNEMNQFKSNMIPEHNVNNFQNMKIEPNLGNYNLNDQKLSESVIIDNNKFMGEHQEFGNQFQNNDLKNENMGIGYGVSMKFGEENPYLLLSGNNNKSQNFFGDNNLSSENDKKDVPSS